MGDIRARPPAPTPVMRLATTAIAAPPGTGCRSPRSTRAFLHLAADWTVVGADVSQLAFCESVSVDVFDRIIRVRQVSGDSCSARARQKTGPQSPSH
jgi:hypothetical protein